MHIKIPLLVVILIILYCDLAIGNDNKDSQAKVQIPLTESTRPPFTTSPRYLSHQKLFSGLEQHFDIVFLGDSITNAGRWSEAFLAMSVANRGISGDTSKGILNRIEQIIKLTPNTVYIMFGVNDFKRGYNAEEVFKRYKTIINKLAENEIEIIIQSTLLSNRPHWNEEINQLNVYLSKYSADYGYQYINLNSLFAPTGELTTNVSHDGVHLKAEMYLQWFELLKNKARG